MDRRDRRGRPTGPTGTDGTFSDTLSGMARLNRIVVVNVPHHVTQRGNARQFLLAGDGDVEQTLVRGNLAGVSGCRRNGTRDRGDSPMHAHGPSVGHAGIRPYFGANNAAPVGAAERWASGAWNGSSRTSDTGIRKIALIRDGYLPRKRKRPVCPRFPPISSWFAGKAARAPPWWTQVHR